MKNELNQPDEIVDGETVRRAFTGSVIKQIDPEKRQIEFLISNASVDRYGDIVEVAGWDLKNYRANPVVLFGHMSSIPPIGKAIKVWKDKDALRAIAEFIPQDISAFAHSIFRMYEEKFLRAVSVGFRPLKWERIVDEEGNETWSYRFKKQELLEFSAVPIPANPEALVAARQKGIDTAPFKQWAEEMLDRWNEAAPQVKSLYGIGRKEMETIRRRASGAGSVYRVPPDVQDEIMKKNLEAIRAAKAKKEAEDKNHSKITVRGIEYELPFVNTADESMQAGAVTLNADEVDGKKSIHIEKSDDKALFLKELLESDSVENFMSVAVRDGTGETTDGLILTLKGDDSTVEYNLVGVTEDGATLYGIKISEKSMDDVEEGEDENKAEDLEDKSKSSKEEDEDEEDKSKADDDDADDEDKAADDDEDDSDDDSSDDDDDDDEKPSKGKADDEDDEDEDKEMDFNTHLHFMNDVLAGFEDALDKNTEKSHTRREMRHLEFLAGYMRELADRLDGGKGKDKAAPAATTTTTSVESSELTEGEAKAYLKQVTDSLQPLLSEIVASKIGKLRGRLD